MMEIFFKDPGEIPLPPRQVRIQEIQGIYNQNTNQIKLFIKLDPFLVPPNLEITIIHPENLLEMASTNIIESLTNSVEISLHLRHTFSGNEVEVRSELYYLAEQIKSKSKHDGSYDDFSRITIDQKSFSLKMN